MTRTRNGDTMGRPATRNSSAAASPSPTGKTSPVPVGARPIKPPTIRQLHRAAGRGNREAMRMLDAWSDAR